MKNINKLVLLGSLFLTACTTSPDKCDPSISDPSFLDKLGCVASGSYEKRVNAKSQEIKDLAAQQKELSQSVIELESQRSAIISDRTTRLAEMDKINDNLSSLEASLRQKNAMTKDLQTKINNVRNSSEAVKNLDEDASIMEKKAKVAQLKKQYDELLDSMAQGY
ncbi:hypothetical protein SAMN02910357_00363 [Succinivibrio dextrinosolvens]|uniref:hypothetical protein n=1 Tax=Succinivibrio dextrinosolvens TaxID=83771 RepID=UPI0008EF6275|nr:hypothetical protein [Succinivibrio dextrinosolvens]SFS36661.1 hypothetical protein SAMN02910357_00363 [Succinivibrio dextrinosolvens]